MDKGITRIDIISDNKASRMQYSEKMWPTANELYSQIFADMGIKLKEGYEQIKTPIDKFMAGYDHKLGIDVILTFWTGQESTLQEKFLTTQYNTITVEFYNDQDTEQDPGDWFNMKATYYFVGYWMQVKRGFERWILLDWPAVQRATAKGDIPWEEKPNGDGHAQANFKFVEVSEIPNNCILAIGGNGFCWYSEGLKKSNG